MLDQDLFKKSSLGKMSCRDRCKPRHKKRYYKYCCDYKPKKKCCPAIDDSVCYNREVYQCKFKEEWAELCRKAKKKLAIIADGDCRLDVYRALGLCIGDADVYRNVGGVVTQDMLRSLMFSQEENCTEEIMLVAVNDTLGKEIRTSEYHVKHFFQQCQWPSYRYEGFVEVENMLKNNAMRILRDPFIKHKKCLRAFIYFATDGRHGDCEYKAGELAEVCLDKVFEKACTKADFCEDDCSEEEHCDEEYQCCKYKYGSCYSSDSEHSEHSECEED